MAHIIPAITKNTKIYATNLKLNLLSLNITMSRYIALTDKQPPFVLILIKLTNDVNILSLSSSLNILKLF